MIQDKEFCMSSYLMYRYVYDNNYCFKSGITPAFAKLDFPRTPVSTAEDLGKALRGYVEEACQSGKTALALSGGIDSAILARYMPKGSSVYTFRCVVPEMKVIDESRNAANWAEMNGLNHIIIDITWEDVEQVIDVLLRHKGAPVHSIEAQIYIAALKVRYDGYENFIFGENADIIYGGMNGLLEKDWLFGEFVDRYSYVKPYYVLKNPRLLLKPFEEFEKDGHIDSHNFINKYFRQEALGSYQNACASAGVRFIGPYSMTNMAVPIDYERIRSGDSKYLIRELFTKLYPDEQLPDKIPMPRPVNEWFRDWAGPERKEFLPHCADALTGDQKWMVWCLERFLNLIEGR